MGKMFKQRSQTPVADKSSLNADAIMVNDLILESNTILAISSPSILVKRFNRQDSSKCHFTVAMVEQFTSLFGTFYYAQFQYLLMCQRF